MTVSLSTDRLIMQAPTPADRDAYRAFYAVSDLDVGHYRRRTDQAEVDALLARDISHWDTKGYGMWLLRRHDDNAVLGGAGFEYADDWQMHEVTWWLMPDARGQGFATEAARAAIDWANDSALWPQVQTFFRDENTRSRRLAERLGGTFDRRMAFPDGIQRDIFVFPPKVAS